MKRFPLEDQDLEQIEKFLGKPDVKATDRIEIYAWVLNELVAAYRETQGLPKRLFS